MDNGRVDIARKDRTEGIGESYVGKSSFEFLDRLRSGQTSITRILFIFIVILPTILTFFYAVMTSAPLYESETQFTIEDRKQNPGANVGGLLASIGIASTGEPNSMYSLRRFLQSPDALHQLEKSYGFRKYYSAPHGDWLTRLKKNADDDEVLNYYAGKVKLNISTTENIMTLEVDAFEPKIAHDLTARLLQISEDFVNRMNNRALEDQVTFRKQELAEAKARLMKAHQAVTDWRNTNGVVDPEAQAKMILGVITEMEKNLAEVRADINQLTAGENATRFQPRVRVLREREASLKKQIEESRSQLVGPSSRAVTNQLADYERLQAEMQYAEKNLEISMASLETARQDATQQHKYLVQISSPTLPSDRSFPLRGFHTLLVFVASSLVFGIVVLLHSILRDYRSV
jgi:capsular polysaccharide transport system permease protein